MKDHGSAGAYQKSRGPLRYLGAQHISDGKLLLGPMA